jgi:hypothetical protein
MSYSNPQRIINKEFDVRARANRELQNTIQNTTASIADAVIKQKKQKEELESSNVEKESALRDKVNEFATPGAGQIDKSIIEFWDTKIEDYVNNMNLAASGDITQREAMLRNKKIEGLLPQFKQNAATLASNAALQKEALNDGTFSSTGSIGNKEILNRLGNNGDVRIVEKDGAIYYWAPELDEDGNVIPDSGSMINGAELYANADKPLFNTKSDISGLISQGWNKFSGEETGISDYVKTIAVKNGDKHPITGETISGLEDGYEQVIRVPQSDNRGKYIDEIESSAYFNGILGNEKEMLSVWQDEIPDGEPDENGEYPPNSLGFFASGGDPNLDIDLDAMGYTGTEEEKMSQWQNSVYGEYPDDVEPEQKALIDKNQKAVSKRYMANLSWDQNSITAGKSKTIGKRKIVEPPKPSTGSGSGESKDKTLYEGLNSTQRATYAGNKRKEDRLSKELEAVQYGPNGEVTKDNIKYYESKGYDFGENPPTTKEEFERVIYSQDGLDDTYFAIKESEKGDEVKVVANSTSTGDQIFGTQPQ